MDGALLPSRHPRPGASQESEEKPVSTPAYQEEKALTTSITLALMAVWYFPGFGLVK